MNLQIGQMWLWENLYNDSCPGGKSLQLPILKFNIDTTKSMIDAMPLVGHCFKPGVKSFIAITFKRCKILIEQIESTCSLESELFFISICSIKIFNMSKVIAKIKVLQSSTPFSS